MLHSKHFQIEIFDYSDIGSKPLTVFFFFSGMISVLPLL